MMSSASHLISSHLVLCLQRAAEPDAAEGSERNPSNSQAKQIVPFLYDR